MIDTHLLIYIFFVFWFSYYQYLSRYAGAGTNTRSNQFIVALEDNGPLGGGSPWEVPWGEFIGEESFVTLDKIFTGYGDDGPSQRDLSKEGFSTNIQKQFPKLDYITSCVISDTIIPKHDTTIATPQK